MKILLDTCIVMDALQDRQPFDAFAKRLLLSAASGVFDAYITAKSVADIYYLTHRLTHDNAKSRMILGRLFETLLLLDTTGEDCKTALTSGMTDYEDAMMVACAKRSGMDAIVTRNLRDFTHSDMTVLSPEQCISRLDL